MTYFNYKGKQIYYTEAGQGQPLFMLHGDTASSKMFELLLPLYQEDFHIILMDFLGNGQSERVDRFPPDVWYQQADQVVKLIQHLGYSDVALLGTSGGAWSALNAALEHPELVSKVIADSFDGRTLADDFTAGLVAERNFAKADSAASQFYEWCQGEDWQTVVDLNTEALLACANKKLPLFHRPLSEMKAAVLFLGSKEDSMIRADFADEYSIMAAEFPRGAALRIFNTGGHPLVLSKAEETARIVKEFLE